jgi:C-terminal processing protease CtpA/Prc
MEIVLPDKITGEVTKGAGLYIEPAQTRFTGLVISFVNSGSISSGEGIALGIKNLPNGKVVGFRGTNGSFGMGDGTGNKDAGRLLNNTRGTVVNARIKSTHP